MPTPYEIAQQKRRGLLARVPAAPAQPIQPQIPFTGMAMPSMGGGMGPINPMVAMGQNAQQQMPQPSPVPWWADGKDNAPMRPMGGPAKSQQPGFGAPPPMMGSTMNMNGDAMVNSQDPSSLAYAPGVMSDNYQDMFASQVQRQPQPGDEATGQDVANKAYDKNPQSTDFWGQLSQGVEQFGYDNLGIMGLALLNGAQQGGSWAPAQEAFTGIVRGKKEDERYKKADARADAADKREQGAYDQQMKEQQRLSNIRTDTQTAVQGLLKNLPEDADPAYRDLLQYAAIDPDNYSKILQYRIEESRRAADRANTVEDRNYAATQAKTLMQMQVAIENAREKARQDREDARVDNQFAKTMAAQEAQQAAAGSLSIPQLEDVERNIDESLALLEQGRGMRTGGFFDPGATLRYTFGDKAGGDILAQLKSKTANRSLAILATQKGAATEEDAKKADWVAIDPEKMSFQAAVDQLQMYKRAVAEDKARVEAQRIWRRDVGPVGSAFKKLPDGTQVSFDQDFRANYKPATTPAVGASPQSSFVFTKEQLGSTPGARITTALQGLQGARSPEEYDRALAALANMPKDELQKAMAQAPNFAPWQRRMAQ